MRQNNYINFLPTVFNITLKFASKSFIFISYQAFNLVSVMVKKSETIARGVCIEKLCLGCAYLLFGDLPDVGIYHFG